jgi:exopolysaccharide biosynthesis polyprenyl glycosylphosphotransferase
MPNTKRHNVPLIIALALGDLICLGLSLLTASALTSWMSGSPINWPDDLIRHVGYFIAFAIAWPVPASNNRLYISRRRDDMLSLIFDLVKSSAMSLIFAGFVVSFYTPAGTDPAFLSCFGVSTFAYMSTFRVLLQLALWMARARGWNERQVLFIGVNARAKELVAAIHHNPQFGYRLVGVLEDEPARCRMIEEFNLPYLGKFDSLEQVLTRHVVDEVYICLPVRSRYETIQNMAYLCEDSGVSVRMIADLFPLRLATSRFHKIDTIPILALSTVPENQAQLLLQRVTDVVIALAAVLMLSPVFILTALAIKLDTPGPIFFAQERVGLNRRKFKMVKFRSMVVDAEARRQEVQQLNDVDGPIFKAKSDPRVTRVGRFIRKYSIDELPQLFNVLIGHMSLVGPRPALAKEVNQYSWTQHRRLSVKPGMTGLSQIRGRSDLSFKESLDFDLTYIDQWSLGLVFRILLSTIPAVLKGRGAY